VQLAPDDNLGGDDLRMPVRIGNTTWRVLGIALAVLLGLTALAYIYTRVVAADAYALMHLVMELASIIVAAAAFMIAWNTRDSIENGYFIVIAMAGGCIALVDTMHALSYRGMGLVPGASTDLPTQLWLIARYLQASALVVATFYIAKRVSALRALAGFAVATLMLLGILAAGAFPAAFVEGTGLTTFKIASEYVISAAMALGLLGLVRKRDLQDREVTRLMASAILCFIAAELAFTLYTGPFALPNYIGHLLRVAGTLFTYRALVVVAIARPFDVLFTDIKASTDALARSEERFRSTFDQAILGILEIDTSGIVVKANHRISELMCDSGRSVVGKPASDLTHPDDRSAERQMFEELTSGSINEYRLEKRMGCPTGPPVWVSANRSAVLGDREEIRYFIEMLEDVTDRREAELRLERSRDLTSALAAIDVSINSTFDIDDILRTTVTEGARAIGAESAVVLMLERDTWVVRTEWQFPGEILGVTIDKNTMASVIRAGLDGVPLAIEDALDDSLVSTEFTTRFGVKSLIVIPLSFRGQQLGALLFAYHSSKRAFDEDEMAFVTGLSSALTLAIENSRLYVMERTTADALQASLLRIETDIDGIDVGTAYYSAFELSRMGGDFFDVFSLPDNRVAFAVGDVSGKGVEAAAITTIAKSTVRAFAYEWDSPALVVQATNLALLNQLDDIRFVTLLFGVLDLMTGEVRFVCAGHPDPLVCDAAGCAHDVTVHNPPLAVSATIEFEESRTILQPSMRLVAFSDGLLDARRGEDFLGEDAVCELITRMGDVAPTRLAADLLDAAQDYSEGHPPDDIAILAIRYTGPPKAR